jgi:hypothetical protein
MDLDQGAGPAAGAVHALRQGRVALLRAERGWMTCEACTGRTTVDLSSYPDLVVIYLGRVNAPRGLTTLISFGSKIRKSAEAQPDGLFLHENLLLSLFPPHAGAVVARVRD